MSRSYTVIADPEAFHEFIAWLPDLLPGETFYGALLARGKYLRDQGGSNIPTFNSDRHQCARFLTTKDRLYTKIWQTEAPLDSYRIKDIVVPQEALAFYITLNPRSMVKAQALMMQKMVASVTSGRTDVNLYQEAMSAVHQTVARRLFVDFDVDESTIGEYAKEIATIVNPDAISVVVTRGGFHILVNTKRIESTYKRSWYNRMIQLPGMDQAGEKLLPVPGTYQGMHVPLLKPLSFFL